MQEKQLLLRLNKAEQRVVDLYTKIKDLDATSSGIIQVTYATLQTLISTNGLFPGAMYKITGFNKNMPEGSSFNPNGYLPEVLYDDSTDSGVTIYLQAITTNTLSESGHGEFYNPKYFLVYEGGPFDPLTVEERPYTTFYLSMGGQIGQKILNDYFIMHSLDSGNYYLINFTQWTQGGVGGGFSYTRQLITPTMDEPIITFTKTNGGSEKDVIEPGVLEITRGTNQGIFNIAQEPSWNYNLSPAGTEWSRNGMSPYSASNGTGLYGIWDGDNPDPLEVPAYTIDQVVFWGGYAWRNVTGNVGTAEETLALSTDWEKLPYSNTTYYEKVIDQIKVDLNNGILIGRTNIENQITVEFNADQYDWWMGLYPSFSSTKVNPISVMGWGLYSVITPEQLDFDFSGISNVKVINSVCETVNFKGAGFLNVDMNTSYLYDNYIGKDTYISEMMITMYSNFNRNILKGANLYSNTLIHSGMFDNTLNGTSNNRSYISNNLLTECYNGISYNDLTRGIIDQNILSEGSSITSNILGEGSQINFNTLSSSSNIYSNTLSISGGQGGFVGGYITYNTLNKSSIERNTLVGLFINDNTLHLSTLKFLNIVSNIQNNYVKNSYIVDLDLLSATHIYAGGYFKQIFKRQDGGIRLGYYDNSDIFTVVSPNS